MEVSSNLSHFKGFSGVTFKTILSFNELDKIWNTDFEDENLLATRDWLIIGCYTGQRVSDLLRMNSKMIKSVKKIWVYLTYSNKDSKISPDTNS